jgi:hypothetical protein
MLVAADFDTHDCIGKFARHPGQAEGFGLEYLLRRTLIRVAWESGIWGGHAHNMEKTLNMRLGIAPSRGSSDMSNIKNMSAEERVDLYVNLCKAAGVDVSADALLDKATGQ